MKLPSPKYILATVTILTLLVLLIPPRANAVSGADWRPGTIIDDGLFYDNTSMSVNQIQDFLNSKNPSCDTWGVQPAADKRRPDITRAQYARLVGWHGPPYICLKDYHQVPRSDVVINNFNSTATRPDGSISAAQIIKNAADSYGVSPKSLLVLLHKESAGPLTVDSWPLQSQYRNAMGYACPDTAPCDPAYAGFYNQVINAAKRIQTYRQYPNSYRHKPFTWNSTVYYNPRLKPVNEGGCGWSSVYITGYATAGLYNYTPYQPNVAALNNLYGTGDDCSAYGNRNFWRIYNDWFGSTSLRYTPLESPRWMTLSADSQKVIPSTGSLTGEVLPAGLQLYFVDKVYIDGTWYLRTAWDRDNWKDTAIKLSDLKEIQFESFEEPRYMTLNREIRKIDPVVQKDSHPFVFRVGTYARFVKKVHINGAWYYQTEYDSSTSSRSTFPASSLSDISFTALEEPRYMTISNNTPFINLRLNQLERTTSQVSDQLVTHKAWIDGSWHYQTKLDSDSSNVVAARSSYFKDITFSPIATPYSVKMQVASTKYSTRTGLALPINLAPNQVIGVAGIITVDNKQYYQTQFDHEAGSAYGILVNETLPSSINFVSLESPRPIAASRTVNKVDLLTGKTTDITVSQGTSLKYTSKTQIGYKWYLRTEHDTVNNLTTAIPIDDLSI